MEQKYMDKKELSAYMKQSVTTIDRMMKEQKLPYYKFGKSVRFVKDEIDEANERADRAERENQRLQDELENQKKDFKKQLQD